MIAELSHDDAIGDAEVLRGVFLRGFGVVAVEKSVKGVKRAQQLGRKRSLKFLAVGVGAADQC